MRPGVIVHTDVVSYSPIPLDFAERRARWAIRNSGRCQVAERAR